MTTLRQFLPAVVAEQSSEAARTAKLQTQFICPIWAVWFGNKKVNIYSTRYHAEQFMRALKLNGTQYRAFDGKGGAL